MDFTLIKTVSQLILPPGGLILLAGMGLLLWRYRIGRPLIASALALFWLLAIEPVHDLLLNPLERAYPPLNEATLEGEGAIALLGGGLYEKAPEYGHRDSLNGFALMRTLYAAKLARASGYEVYTSGGVAPDSQMEPEGVVMQRWLVQFGVEDAKIHVESGARNTLENAANIAQMLAGQTSRQLIVVTTAWHMPRAVEAFRRAGLKVTAAPCDYRVEAGPYTFTSFLPHWHIFAESCDALHEYLGLLWYRLQG